MPAASLVRLFVVSTHSRLKAAGSVTFWIYCHRVVSTHSRLKAAGQRAQHLVFHEPVSTHSRLKAAGPDETLSEYLRSGFQHTAA